MKNKKHFYSHIITTREIRIELNKLDLTEEEKDELHELANVNIHYEMIDIVLSRLNHEDKKTFLHHLDKVHHETTWKFLKERIENLEEKIIEKSNEVKNKLLEDIERLKNE